MGGARKLIHLFCLILLLSLAGCRGGEPTSSPPPADPAVDAVLRKINERLSLMEDVAAYKWEHGTAIDDPERERAILRDIEARAGDHELSAFSARWFFRAQIQAAKMVQENLHKKWRDEGFTPDPAPDIKQLRERIDKVNSELLAAFAEARKKPLARDLIGNTARAIIDGPGIDHTVRVTAIRPLLEKD